MFTVEEFEWDVYTVMYGKTIIHSGMIFLSEAQELADALNKALEGAK